MEEKTWIITATTEVRRTWKVNAKTEEEARKLFNNRYAGMENEPWLVDEMHLGEACLSIGPYHDNRLQKQGEGAK